MDALAKAAYEGSHQYSITFGAENFREALARKQGKAIGRTINPDTEIVVTCGGTEAMMCAMMTICNPGDKVMVFSPFYENYGADAILSGAEPIYIPLVPPTNRKLTGLRLACRPTRLRRMAAFSLHSCERFLYLDKMCALLGLV